jgi:hypothetical protein
MQWTLLSRKAIGTVALAGIQWDKGKGGGWVMLEKAPNFV